MRHENEPTVTRPRARRAWRRRAVVVGAVALVAGTFAGAEAASLITGRHIKDGTVASRDVRDGAVTGVDVRDGSLGPNDYAGELVGPQGTEGQPGDQGLPGFHTLGVAVSDPVAVGANQLKDLVVECPAGTAVAGGVFDTTSNAVRVVETAPAGSGGAGWQVWVKGFGGLGGGDNVRAYAVCARAL